MPPAEDVESLRARVRELEQQQAGGAGTERPSGSRTGGLVRTSLVTVMLVLASVLAPITVVATWAHDQIGDTDRYVETVAPLASDPAVQSAIATRISEEIFAYIAVDEVTTEVLTALAGQPFVPERAGDLLPSLAVPLSSAIESFIGDRIDAVVSSEIFEDAWVEANRQAHAQLVAVLTGEVDGTVSVEDGAVRVSIASLVAAVKQRLLDEGFAFANRIPEVTATFTIFEAKNIGTAQKWFSWLDTIARVLPVLTLLLVFGAVLIARSRRRALLAAGLCIAGSMILLGLTLNLVRPAYLDAVPASAIPSDAAAVIYDELVRFIRTALRAVGFVALAIAAAAFWFAPSGAGAACRGGASAVLGRIRRRATRAGMDTGPVGTFLSTYRAFTRSVVVGLGALVYLSLSHPTGADALTLIVVIVVVLVVLEFLASGEKAPSLGDEKVIPPG
ncbi:hypothetical protein [Nocardioides sp. W7]|uniref:hypothetical protein n=1 Tax=Nocardioides sp. W7 TaxID=2931390 RepID=UPI001FCF7C9C|nr:hypothetical protein [Nocardioides sp. W7]